MQSDNKPTSVWDYMLNVTKWPQTDATRLKTNSKWSQFYKKKAKKHCKITLKWQNYQDKVTKRKKQSNTKYLQCDSKRQSDAKLLQICAKIHKDQQLKQDIYTDRQRNTTKWHKKTKT